jgi:hypothetical protein
LRERDLFETCRTLVAQSDIAIEILDVELLSDNAVAIVQFVGDDAATETCAHLLEERLHFAIRMENIAGSRQTDDEQHRCDKPDCGRQAGGGCSTCETGGGCSTCGSSKVDLREYFGHLRAKMEHAQRIPLT